MIVPTTVVQPTLVQATPGPFDSFLARLMALSQLGTQAMQGYNAYQEAQNKNQLDHNFLKYLDSVPTEEALAILHSKGAKPDLIKYYESQRGHRAPDYFMEELHAVHKVISDREGNGDYTPEQAATLRAQANASAYARMRGEKDAPVFELPKSTLPTPNTSSTPSSVVPVTPPSSTPASNPPTKSGYSPYGTMSYYNPNYGIEDRLNQYYANDFSAG